MMAVPKRIFSYPEALATFPQIREITEVAVRQVEALTNRLQSRAEMEQQRQALDAEHAQIVETWSRMIRSLGCETKGLWLVDWDNGDGYYCWRYPESNLGFFHTYAEGFAGRVPIH